jgi:PD-(D/E)XK nuclease superfamily
MTIEESVGTSERLDLWRNSSFSVTNPDLQIAWDSTSYGALDKCAQYYEYAIVRGYTLAFGTNDHIKFGWLLHAACEQYDREIVTGISHEDALQGALALALVESFDFERGRPWISNVPEKTLSTLLRTLVWYLDKFKDDPLETIILANGKPAVEHSFSFGIGFDSYTGEEYQLCGHIDKIAEMNLGNWIVDKKTTKYELDTYFFGQFLPDNQVSIYEIAGEVSLSIPIEGFIIDGIRVLVESSRFRRQPLPSSPGLREEFLEDFKIKIRENETYVKNKKWPKNRKACGFGKNQCQFRRICSSDPSVRQELLDGMFTKRTWDPLQPR